MNEDELKKIPGVDSLLEEVDLPEGIPDSIGTAIIRSYLEEIRSSIKSGQACPDESDLINEIEHRLSGIDANRVQPVVNATGVVAHTNLGRAPYSKKASESVQEIVSGYSNLEVDLSSGERGGRGRYAELMLEEISGAEAAGIVNNCSAALLLVLKALTDGGKVLISRGELIQIGGGYRIPEILEVSGASLLEVGTTNRTSVSDYESAMEPDVEMILSVHRSNFEIVGFTSSPDLTELANLADQYDIPLVQDLGSGALWNTNEAGIEREPTPADSIESGADLITFSGDKLLGGPQAGLFVGDEDIVQRMKENPFFRALRCGKATLSGLESTLESYLENDLDEIPVVKLLKKSKQELVERARSIDKSLSRSNIEVREVNATVGGGALPTEEIPSAGLFVETDAPEQTLRKLRDADPPIIARLVEDQVCLNLRTVFPSQDDHLESVLEEI